MNVKIENIDDNMVAILEGSLDTAAAAETEKAMQPLHDVEGKNIFELPQETGILKGADEALRNLKIY